MPELKHQDIVGLVQKRRRHDIVLESTGGGELFSLFATTVNPPGVVVSSTLPGVYRYTLPHEDRYGEGMRQAARVGARAYWGWIKDHLGLDVVVHLTDEAGQVLWCTRYMAAHPPAPEGVEA